MTAGSDSGARHPAAEESGQTQGPLSGYRIIDVTTFLFGPVATQMLGDMGADVIKVEPLTGDPIRHVGPFRTPGMGPIHLHANRNKRSITLDLRDPRGLGVLERLVATADVLVHNLRPKPAERLGLGYSRLHAINARLVYVRAVGFSQRGPYADRPAYDDLIQACAGVAHLTARMTGGSPQYAPTVLADKTGAYVVANAVLGALLARTRTGMGQDVEVCMFETLVANLMIEHMAGETFVPPIGETGYARALSRFRHPFATRDGHICVMPYSDANWQDFFRISGSPESAQDERFLDLTRRTGHIDALYGLVEQLIVSRTTADWLEILAAADIPCAPVNALEDLFTDPHLQAVEFFKVATHPTEGDIRVIGSPVTYSGTPANAYRPAPSLGQHGAELMREIGISDAEIARLTEAGVTTTAS